MSKAKKKGGDAPVLPPGVEMDGYAEPLVDAPAAPVVSQPIAARSEVVLKPGPVTRASTYLINFRHIDTAGIPRSHTWLPWMIPLDGCESAEDARKKLHELVDSAVFQIEQARN